MASPILLNLNKKLLRKYRGKLLYEYSVIYKDNILATRQSTCNYMGSYVTKVNDKYELAFMFTGFHTLASSTYKTANIFAIAVFPEFEKMVLERMLINVVQS